MSPLVCPMAFSPSIYIPHIALTNLYIFSLPYHYFTLFFPFCFSSASLPSFPSSMFGFPVSHTILHRYLTNCPSAKSDHLTHASKMVHCHPAIYITAKSRSATRSTFDPSDNSDNSDNSDTYTDIAIVYTDIYSDIAIIYTDISPNSLTPYGNRHATSVLLNKASNLAHEPTVNHLTLNTFAQVYHSPGAGKMVLYLPTFCITAKSRSIVRRVSDIYTAFTATCTK